MCYDTDPRGFFCCTTYVVYGIAYIILPDYYSYVHSSYTIPHHAGLPAGQHAMTWTVKLPLSQLTFFVHNNMPAS